MWHIKVHTVTDIPKKAIAALVKQAAQLKGKVS